MKLVPVIAIALLLSIASVAEARHQSSVDRDDLDDDVVDEFPIPVLFGITLDNIVPDFGAPRGGGTREHEGQDFIAPQGAPIVSPTEAIVLSTGTGSSAGKYVYTANPGGETFRYMHLDEIADFDRGDELAVGDYIGTVGDTGNAPDGVYHLHFETRDDDNDAEDPYDRLAGEFSLKEQASALKNIFKLRKDDDDYAEFLVEEYVDEIQAIVAAGHDLPSALEEVLDDEGISDQIEQQTALKDVLAQIPRLLPTDISVGDQGIAVQLLQLHLLYFNKGEATERLRTAGPTGYFGPITRDALAEYQVELDVEATGVFDRDTQEAFD